MNEEILSEDENIEFDEDFAYQGPVKNKYETGEVKSIQKAIQEVTRKIEQEKIKLRITDERLEGKKIQYNQLLGQPVQKTEEEKEKEHKEKIERNKKHVLETKQKPKKVNKAEEFRLIQRKQNKVKLKKENNLIIINNSKKAKNKKKNELDIKKENEDENKKQII